MAFDETKFNERVSVAHKELDDLFESCICPFDAWESKTARFVLLNEYVDWLMDLADWSTFLTLTFRDSIGDDGAYNKWRSLVQILNRDLFGNHYTRRVGHSYFSYILCAEYQTRDVLHFHVVIDRPVDYQLIHTLWNRWAGFAQTRKIVNKYSAVRYTVKYAIKEDDIKIYRAKAFYKPVQYPIWWKSIPEDTI
jgi:hypothetical protein